MIQTPGMRAISTLFYSLLVRRVHYVTDTVSYGRTFWDVTRTRSKTSERKRKLHTVYDDGKLDFKIIRMFTKMYGVFYKIEIYQENGLMLVNSTKYDRETKG